MQNILFDTSVWVNYSRGIKNKQTDLLDEYLTFKAEQIRICPTIIQEFLMGLKTAKEVSFYKLHFSRFLLSNIDWLDASISAAKLYFDLKKKGITIRKANDCLIAQIAIDQGLLLVHNDADFDLIATGSELQVF
jgi:predicted nucleic acid-binding protein